jgi:hypothetical protein
METVLFARGKAGRRTPQRDAVASGKAFDEPNVLPAQTRRNGGFSAETPWSGLTVRVVRPAPVQGASTQNPLVRTASI